MANDVKNSINYAGIGTCIDLTDAVAVTALPECSFFPVLLLETKRQSHYLISNDARFSYDECG